MSNRRRLRREHYYKVDVWRTVGGIIRREIPEDACKLGAWSLQYVGFSPRSMTSEAVVDSLRELYVKGFLDVGDDGAAFLTRPLTGPEGALIDRIPLSEEDQRDMMTAFLEEMLDQPEH